MNSLTLYSTSACHLCEQAEAILYGLQREGAGVEFEVVDIADSDDLFERYGLRIPVLRHPDGREMGWPFDRESLLRFLG